jgi:methenyltetrahydromethanopterin cyclohydrolase
MEALNLMAIELVDEAIDFADELALEVWELDNGATVIDFGVETVGGLEAGLLLTEIQTAGLATVQAGMREVAEAPLTHIELSTDHPALSLLCSQKAGWEVETESFAGLGSGPARALVAEEEEFARTGYTEEADFSVLAIESDSLPVAAVAEQVADRAEVNTEATFLPVFATASVTGSVTLAARAAELAVYRLAELGYDPLDILSVTGRAPVAPVGADEETAIGRTNDALAYGGQVHLTVGEPFDRFSEVASSASADHGTPFATIFDDADWEFAELDRGIFAPAKVTIDVVGGGTHVIGEMDEALLANSFGL